MSHAGCLEDIPCRYTIESNDGELRFVSFKVLPPIRDTKLGNFLVGCFLGRPLRKVRQKDIPSDCWAENKNYLGYIIDHIMDLKEQLCCLEGGDKKSSF